MNEEAAGNTGGSWEHDPFGRHQRRWWDGRRWTRRVRDDDRVGIDPPGVDPQPQAAPRALPVRPITDAPLPIGKPDDRALVASVVAVLVVLAIAALILFLVLA